MHAQIRAGLWLLHEVQQVVRSQRNKFPFQKNFYRQCRFFLEVVFLGVVRRKQHISYSKSYYCNSSLRTLSLRSPALILFLVPVSFFLTSLLLYLVLS